MAKEFKTHQSAIEYHLKNITEVRDDAIPKLTKMFVADCNDQFVPELTAELKNSAFRESKWDEGVAIWDTDYARRRFYEGSITGIAYWTIVNQEINGAKYLDYLKKLMKEGT